MIVFGILISILAVGVLVVAVLAIFSPKFKGMMMSKQVKATKYMLDESKDDIQSISTDMADATSKGIEKTTRAIKKGLTEDEKIFCKHCGAKIDKDSTFCSKCGKKIKTKN